MAGLGGLVAYDGSGSSSEDEDEMITEEESGPKSATATVSGSSSSSASELPNSNHDGGATTLTKPIKSSSVIFSKFIDDDDDDIGINDVDAAGSNGLGDDETIVPEPVWSKFLPEPKKAVGIAEVGEDEEIGPIPPKKTYGDEELPPPKSSTVGSITATKFRGKVRISIPFLNSLDDADSAEDGKRKLMQPSEKGSGLFAILPQPKNSMSMSSDDSNIFIKSNTSTANKPHSSSSTSSDSQSTQRTAINRLIPDSVKNKLKRPAPEKIKEIRAKYLKKDATASSSSSSAIHKDSDGSDDEDGGNFFSFGSEDVADPEALERLKLPMPDFSTKAQSSATREESMDTEDYSEYQQQEAASSSSQDLMKFIQPKKGRKEDVQIIDINADDLRPDNTEWIKNITDESAVPARRSKGLGGMVKRKHQITYLAFEAKAREQELKNQWAQNRANKMATKNKYGF